MIIYGHRGYSGRYPENTMLSFKKAVEAGADGIELDVQMTRDGKMVIIHDETLDRTTNGTGWVKDFSLEELKLLDASLIKPGEFEPQEIPAFEEYCEWVKDLDITTNVELKTSVVYYDGIEEQLADYIKQYHLEDRVLFSSFNHLSALNMKKLLPDCPIGALVENDDLQNAGNYCKKFGFENYHPDSDLFTKENLENCKENGIGVNVWTVNDLDTFEMLYDWGVTGIFTNYPRVLSEYVKHQS